MGGTPRRGPLTPQLKRSLDTRTKIVPYSIIFKLVPKFKLFHKSEVTVAQGTLLVGTLLGRRAIGMEIQGRRTRGRPLEEKMVEQSEGWYQREGTVGGGSIWPCYMEVYVIVYWPHIKGRIRWRERRLLEEVSEVKVMFNIMNHPFVLAELPVT